MHRCPACNESISGDETTCPHCGVALYPHALQSDDEGGQGTRMYVTIIVGVGMTIAILFCVGCLGTRGAFRNFFGLF